MTATILGIVSSLILLIIGIWQHRSKQTLDRNQKIEEANAIITEGIRETNVSKINAGFARLRNLE
jgi:cytochrome oxidase assembly protein ShyY1